MAFVVEDGTSLPDANSYCSVEETDSYFSDRGNATWSGETTLKQYALINATDYIDLRWGRQFPGKKAQPLQALSFPRSLTNDFDNIIPDLLKRACFEYAVRALSGSLVSDPTTQNGILTYTKMRKLGPLQTEYGIPTSGFGSKAVLFAPYPVPDQYIQSLLSAMGVAFGRVIR